MADSISNMVPVYYRTYVLVKFKGIVLGKQQKILKKLQFIRTKLIRPRLGQDLITRPHLVQRLHKGAEGKLALISAPAGYGKTVLDIIASRLVNEAATISEPVLIILDDLHVINNQEIHQLVNMLIQYLPAQLHLVILTRQDPPLDIIDLRVKGPVSEI